MSGVRRSVALTKSVRSMLVLLAACGGLGQLGCGAAQYQVGGEIPTPVVVPLPLSIAVRLPKAFTEYVQKDELNQSKIVIQIGTAQAGAMRRITSSMFQHTLLLGDEAPADTEQMTAQNVAALLEVGVDSYVYLQPTNGGSEFYSATIGYKLDLRSPDGKALGSWIYEGYGSVPERGSNMKDGITRATALAIRDACANIAVHLPQQEIIQKLLAPPTPSATNGTPTP